MVAGKRAGVRIRRGLRSLAAAGVHHDDRLAGGARLLRNRKEFRRTAYVFGVQHNGLGRLVQNEELDEIDEIGTGFIAGRHHKRRRNIAAFKRLTQMRHEAAALRQNRHCRSAGVGELRHHGSARKADCQAIDEVAVTQAVRAEHRNVALRRDLDELVLTGRIADFRETRREDNRSTHLAACAGFKRFLHAGRRQGEYGEIDAFRQIIDGGKYRTALDGAAAAANEMDGAGELVECKIGQNRMTG